jgi:hypothetical protein
MKLFVANISKKRHVFQFQLPERSQLTSQAIGPLSQIQVGGDMSMEEIQAIIDQRSQYGFKEWREARRSRKYEDLCYGIGSPVPIETFYTSMETNDAAVNEQSETIHEQAAVAMVDKLETQLGKPIKRLEVENIEDKKIGQPGISKGVEVVKPGVQPNHSGGNVVVKK